MNKLRSDRGNAALMIMVVTASLLATAISTPVWGKLADLTNRKVLYQLAIVIFVVASATGPVGATVGQIGKILGCRVVGVAELVGGGLVDRHLPRAGGRVGRGARMDLQRIELLGHLRPPRGPSARAGR